MNPGDQNLVEMIDAWLPQTQCTQCGYPRCREYAAAIANGDADINQCPPGADVTITALARLLGRAAKPLNPDNGVHRNRTRALIVEEHCIGCTLCLDACPVDAIVGANKRMHTVITAHCTGCELCVPPCPVDCIELAPVALLVPGASSDSPWPEYSAEEVEQARVRNQSHVRRLQQQAEQKKLTQLHRRARGTEGARRIRNDIVQALQRVNARKSGSTSQR